MFDFLLGFLAGMVLGGVITRIVQIVRSTTGSLIINMDDPNEEYLKLRLHYPDDLFIKRKKYVHLTIRRINDNTSK